MESSKVELVVPQDLKILLEGASRAVLQNKPDDIAGFIALYFQELVALRTENPDLNIRELINTFDYVSENRNEELEEKISEHIDILFSGKLEKREKCTDTEEDQLLEEPDIQYSSQQTQYPSVASSIAETISPTGDDEASAPEGPELAYVPADPAQLAAHVLGNSDSLYSVRDVATSVQTLQDFETSEDELTPVEGAAEDASAVPAAEASVETIRSQPGVRSQLSAVGEPSPSDSQADVPAAEAAVETVRSQPGVQGQLSAAGEPRPSDSQADVLTNDVNQASSVPLWEVQSPSPLLPPSSPAPKDALQAVPSSNKTVGSSATDVVSLWWDYEPMEAPPYIEQFPEKIIIPFVDQTAYLLKMEQPLNADQGSSVTTLVLSDDELVCHPETMESTAQVESAEQVYVLSAMASSEAARPPLSSNVWTLYCLTDLKQGQKLPPSLPPDGACAPHSQAPLCLSRGEDQQYGQLSEVPAPIYVMREESKRGNAPPFILVGSNVQNTEDWKPIPSHAVIAQQHTGVRRRFTTVPIPVARPAAEETDMPSPGSNPAEEAAAKLCTPDVFSVAIPLDDVLSAKKRLGSW